MSKDIEEIRHWKAVCERTYEIIKEEQQRIEQLQKEVEHQRKCKRKYRKIADNFLDEKTKLKERVKELEEDNNKLLSCSYCGSFDIRKD